MRTLLPLVVALTVAATGPAPDASSPTPSATVVVGTPLDPTAEAGPTVNAQGVLVVTIERECGVSPFAGCQGQAIPQAVVRVQSSDGRNAMLLRTGDDGSFRVVLPTGCYRVEDLESGRSVDACVRTGAVESLVMLVPR